MRIDAMHAGGGRNPSTIGVALLGFYVMKVVVAGWHGSESDENCQFTTVSCFAKLFIKISIIYISIKIQVTHVGCHVR